MNNWQACVLNQNSTVLDVIRNLNETSARAVLVVDSDQKFVGIVVDGDIRRGMLRGVVLTDQISEIINRDPITVSVDVKHEDARKMMETLKILHLPIIDPLGQLCGLHLFNELLCQPQYGRGSERRISELQLANFFRMSKWSF